MVYAAAGAVGYVVVGERDRVVGCVVVRERQEGELERILRVRAPPLAPMEEGLHGSGRRKESHVANRPPVKSRRRVGS